MSISSLAPPDLYLLPGEVPETRDREDARQWVSIYRELVTFSERTLNRLRKGSSDTDERVMEPTCAGCNRGWSSGSGVPAQLVSEPRRGYGLVFTA